jgi:hypothetical protein
VGKLHHFEIAPGAGSGDVTSFVVLTTAEAMATADAIEILRPLPWAKPLLDTARDDANIFGL